MVGSPGHNLEVKAIDPDPAQTLAACLRLAAEDRGTLHQRDTYFHAVEGRLKLREAPPTSAELIAYARTDRAEPRPSWYRIVPVIDPAGLAAAALGASLRVRVVVEKARRLLLWRHVRIHLDRVAGLGSFVELEAVTALGGGLADDERTLAEVRDALAISDDRLVAQGYADLLEARGG